MANIYVKDNQIRLSVGLIANNAFADPTTVKAFYKDPNGVVTTLVYGTDSALVKDAVGKYHVDVYGNVAGTWFYRFEGSGIFVVAGEAQFIVSLSNIL